VIPAGWSLVLDRSTRRTEGGRVVIGGAPLRLLRLTEDGARWLDAIEAGAAVSMADAHRQLARRLVDAGVAHPRPPRRTGPSTDDVAVVVPVRDMAEGLSATLGSVGPVGEVVVVDDGSADAVRATACGSRVLRNDRSLGPAGARDRGWRASEAPFVAFVDAEVEGAEGWLADLLPHFDDESVGAVAPRVRASPGHAPRWLAAYERVRSSLDLGPEPARVRPGSTVPYVPTTAIVVRRAALESVGGLDPALRYGEDVDLVWRLHAEGWRVRYDPSVEVTHPTRPTFAGWIRQRMAYGTSAAALARRHGDRVTPLHVSTASAATCGAALLGHPAIAGAISLGSTAALARKLDHLEHPTREGARMVTSGTAWSLRHAVDALRRPWWPFALLLALKSRRARPALVAALLLPNAIEGRNLPREITPLQFAGLRLADDVAYGTGVWLGCLRQRSIRALLPALTRSR
jgi:mycofactocin system glycosyltransferase